MHRNLLDYEFFFLLIVDFMKRKPIRDTFSQEELSGTNVFHMIHILKNDFDLLEEIRNSSSCSNRN